MKSIDCIGELIRVLYTGLNHFQLWTEHTPFSSGTESFAKGALVFKGTLKSSQQNLNPVIIIS